MYIYHMGGEGETYCLIVVYYYLLLLMKVQIQYAQKERRYVLTPSRKYIGKSVARGSRHAIVSNCLEDPVMRKYIISRVGKIVQSEVATLCSDKSNSVLRRHSKEQLLKFKWKDVNIEMREHAPILLSLLHAATRTQRSRPNQEAVIAMCSAMMCKLRRGEMSAAHKTLSLILYAGHASKQVNYPTVRIANYYQLKPA